MSDRLPPPDDRHLFSRRLAILMDDLLPIPGTRRGIGLDALIGLVPGIGDVAGSGLSAAIMLDAVRSRVPVPTLARMAWNILLDALLGLVPFVGDLLDVAHRANRRNYLLLREAVAAHPDPGPPTAGYLAAALALTVLPVLLAAALGVVTLVLLYRWLTG